jgi:hypothetical protein
MSRGLGFLGLEVDAGKMSDGPVDRERVGGPVGRYGIVYPERADPGPDEPGQMRAAVKPIPHLGHQRADVRSGRAGHPKVEVSPVEAQHVEGVDPDSPGWGLYRVPFPGGGVELAAANLHRRESRRSLLDLTDQRLRGLVEAVAGDIYRGGSDDTSVGVQRVGLLPQTARPLVLLVQIAEEPEEPGSPAHPHEQKPRGHRIEGSSVPHLPRAEGTPNRVDGVVRSDSGRLVDEEESLRRCH